MWKRSRRNIYVDIHYPKKIRKISNKNSGWTIIKRKDVINKHLLENFDYQLCSYLEMRKLLLIDVMFTLIDERDSTFTIACRFIKTQYIISYCVNHLTIILLQIFKAESSNTIVCKRVVDYSFFLHNCQNNDKKKIIFIEKLYDQSQKKASKKIFLFI
jgi:hypothetical protein